MGKKLLFAFLPFLFLMITPIAVKPAEIIVCTFDKDTYHQGDTGHIAVTIYNEKDDKIRITELTATIEYRYNDGNIYLQSFFSDAILPAEIQEGQSSTFYIPFSLPTNIASGYTDVQAKAKTELWSAQAERWFPSEHPTYQPTLYIESPYKSQSEGQLSMIYLLGAASTVLAVAMMFLVILNRRARYVTQPAS